MRRNYTLFAYSCRYYQMTNILVSCGFDYNIYIASKRTRDESTYTLETWRSKRFKGSVPSVHELRRLLDVPLTSSDKIRAPQSLYDIMISSQPEHRCTERDMNMLFKLSDEADISMVGIYSTIMRSLPVGGTDKSFIASWDNNIRHILELLIPDGSSFRNDEDDAETRKLRPDYGFLLRIWTDDFGNPRTELVYDDAPYVFGYYAVGSKMTPVAIAPPTKTSNSKPVIYDLVSTDLRSRTQRIATIRRILNMAPLLCELAALVRNPIGEFKVFERLNGTIELTSTVVIKCYTDVDAEKRVEDLRRSYNILARWSVPHTDRVIYAQGTTVHLSPRGLASSPETEAELRQCLLCVLESLVIAHGIPLYHRDIRWQNIIRRIDDSSQCPPTKAQPTFSSSNHSPDIFRDGHGTEVDIWSIGHLIRTSTAAGIPIEFRVLGQRICEEASTLTASRVLDLVNSTP
ncbi:hypothetical protein CPB84DRAFT_1793794 [Gymnopilus junonius]|uniref:Protein kinase domain-containing protein n=1 Tax=Gymnopilus junonius TaxID=109634 RepID=A0A9P5NDS5_GYMJU|nr:hypothetical protein CPB84DRAFT_1793794 [Gymnopilus junonius]